MDKKPVTAYDWRVYRDYLMELCAFRVEVGTIEYNNISRRIQWVSLNRCR
jgi:hypothetical protein